MARTLTIKAQNMLTDQNVKTEFTFLVNSVDYTSSVINWQMTYDRNFGAASAQFTLENNGGKYGDGGSSEISIGDTIELKEKFTGDTFTYKKFYGLVKQRSIIKSDTSQTINLICLDYISTLQYLDIDYEREGTKVEIIEETLTPNYLSAPNQSLSQVFDFANDQIATVPEPVILIKNKDNDNEDPQYDGFEITYSTGQLRLGFPLNALDNYDIIARSYYFYTQGVYIEDILESILIQEDGYGKFLFNESTAQAVIDTHLTSTYLAETGNSTDTLIPNFSTSTIIIKTQLSSAVTVADTSISVNDTTGFPTSGSGNINGDTFTWTGKTTTTLTGVPTTGSNALKAHNIASYVEYSADYTAGQVWYLRYSNIQTTLTTSDFTITGGTFNYFDERQGRILLSSAIAITASVTCNNNYSFRTLQATGIELNNIKFRSREVKNRFDAINKLREYLAPNYIIRTIGDNKIWASYLYQKTREDYTLELMSNLNYLEDEEIYTRVIMYGKHNNPTNLVFQDGVDFIAGGESYKAIATNSQLGYLRESGNYYVYSSFIGHTSSSAAQSSTTKWPTTIANDSSVGQVAWTNLDNVKFDDATFATVSMYVGLGQIITNYLKTTNFNFSIPSDSTISGIVVGIKKKTAGSPAHMKDYKVHLVINNSIVTTENKASTEFWPSAYDSGFEYTYYGTSSSIWGETLTPAIVNSSTFGVAISAENVRRLSCASYIDTVVMTITYSIEASTPDTNYNIGKITANTIKPIVYVNNVPIDNTSHQIVSQSVVIEVTTKTEKTTEGGGK